MRVLFWITVLATGLLMPGGTAQADFEVMTRNDIVFAEHDGVKLLGDLYAPKGVDKIPAQYKDAVQYKCYLGAHQMYLDAPARTLFSNDVKALIRAAVSGR